MNSKFNTEIISKPAMTIGDDGNIYTDAKSAAKRLAYILNYNHFSKQNILTPLDESWLKRCGRLERKLVHVLEKFFKGNKS